MAVSMAETLQRPTCTS